MTPIEHQAEFFAKNNEEKIKCARDLIAKVAVAMQNAIQSTELVKTPGLMESIVEMTKGNFDSINFVRNQAVELCSVLRNGIFWDFIDAVNFYHDCLGTNWRYLSMDCRARYLGWSMEKCNDFFSQMNTATA
jgi:hypothetical protein